MIFPDAALGKYIRNLHTFFCQKLISNRGGSRGPQVRRRRRNWEECLPSEVGRAPRAPRRCELLLANPGLRLFYWAQGVGAGGPCQKVNLGATEGLYLPMQIRGWREAPQCADSPRAPPGAPLPSHRPRLQWLRPVVKPP